MKRQSNLFSFFTPPASNDGRKEVSDSDPSTDEEPEVEPKDQPVPKRSKPDCIPSDLATTKNQSPCQPKLSQFPLSTIAGKQRSFNSSWYSSYSWLEYSIQQDACFCFPCRMFHVEQAGSKDKFTKLGFSDWKHATGKSGILSVHDRCASHRRAMESWSQYKLNTQLGSSISDRMESSHSEVVSTNRHYVKTLIEVLLLCAHQEIALRGHRESVDSANRGNFLEILHVLASHDPVVQQKLLNGPRNAVYTSAEIQNTLLSIMGKMVREEVCKRVKSAGVYSISADETKDISKTEQMALVIRYVDIKEACIYERFLTFVEVSSLDAKSLTEYILGTLKKYQLDLGSLVSQGYDGASVMSGKFSGVQQRVMQIAPQAIYIHCFAHILNLVLVDCAKKISSAAEFFALLQSLYVFISSTKAHVVYVRQQAKLHPDRPKKELQRLSDTRWTCRYLAVNVICNTFDAILATLSEIADGDDPQKAIEAQGLLLQIQSFTFLLHLVTFDRVLSCTKMLSDLLQHRQCNLAKAVDLVSSTIETLEGFRSDSFWQHLYEYTEQVANLNSIPVTVHSKRQRRVPHRFDDSVVLESVGSRDTDHTINECKVSIFFPILDTFIVELKLRFTSKNMSIMKAIQACSDPQDEKFFDPDTLAPLSHNYHLDHAMVSMEALLAKRAIVSKNNIEGISNVLKELHPLKEAFPNLTKLLQIALTICVSSAQCERSFSALKRIKSYLRSTMSEQRLVDLACLSIEHDISNKLNVEEVIDNFAAQSRRITLL